MVIVVGCVLDFNNKLIIEWCTFAALGCNSNAGANTNKTLPLTLKKVLSFANVIDRNAVQGDWAKCSNKMEVTTTKCYLELWAFGNWAAHGVKVIILGSI